MAKVISSVRITPLANQRLSRLAARLKQPKAQVIEAALKALEERIFWRSVQESFAQGESIEMRLERELWDSTVSDGLTGERW